MLSTMQFHRRSPFRTLALFALAAAFALPAPTRGVSAKAAAKTAPVWVRVELVENTVEGPAYDRCEVEGTLKSRDAHSWRLFYGEARAGAGAAWEPVRSQSGCGAVASDRAANPWTLRGAPYLLVDVTLEPTNTSEKEVTLQASLTIRRLTGFENGKPAYEQRTESRTLRVMAGSSAVIPVLAASRQETDAFGVREVLLRVRSAGPRPRTEYGEIAVTADEPRAIIFLDGGFVGRTSSAGPVVLSAVRTGKREISVVDPSGREARSVVNVEKGGRANVSLTLLPKPAGAGPAGLRPLGRNPQGAEEFWREKDGALLVRVPGGEFKMGSAEGKGEANERPQHAVRVRGFLMDKTEVTWGQYKRFMAASSQPAPKTPIWGTPEALPASSITWNEANAYCTWAGGRLPTEAEWERAARADDAREFPWGNTFDPWRCNTRDGGPHAPTAAGDYPDCVDPYGVLDLAGSVAEWCSDYYEDGYYAKSPADNPTGPETGSRRVTRGGDWMSSSFSVRAASRIGIDATWPGYRLGFRCVQDDLKADEK